jgi:predicted outer membrane repeat protein
VIGPFCALLDPLAYDRPLDSEANMMNQSRRILILLALIAGGLAFISLTLSASASPDTPLTYPGPNPCNTTLQACIDGSSSGDVITIAPNTYVTTVVLNKAVSLIGANLNTTILKAPPGQRAFRITGAAVTADTVVSDLTIQGDVLATENGAGILVENGAQPTLQNLTIQSGTVSALTAVGGGLFTASSLTLTNVTFFQNVAFAGHGGGLAGGPGAHLKLVNAIFDGNGADQGGGGLYADSATIIDSAFAHNVAGFTGQGGGVLITGTVNVTNSSFIQNQAHESGGGLATGGDANVQGGLFRGNITLDENGGALIVGGDLLLDGTAIFASQSFDSGGAIFVTGTTTIDNALIAQNRTTGGAGGGLRAIGAVNINNSQFISNTSHNQGGGLRATGALVLTNTTFMSNTTTNNSGGGLDAVSAATVTGGSFIGNSTKFQGGGARFLSTLVMSGTVIRGNQAGTAGGGLHLITGTVRNAAFDQNQVLVGNGGGLAAANVLTVSQSVFAHNRVLSGTQPAATGSGGGIFGDGFVNSTGNTFSNNFAYRLGGGMDADDLQSTGDEFRGNLTAPQSPGFPGGSGGGLFVSGDFDLAAGLFIANTSYTAGGLGVNSTAAGSVVNSLFARNIVTFTDGGAAMRLLSTQSVSVIHNTIVGISQPGRAAIHLQNTGTFTFFNNIISQHAQGIKNFGTVTATQDYNLFFGVGVMTIGPFASGASSFTADPLFIDPAGDNYHLACVSPAIDAALFLGVPFDFDGQPRGQPAGDDIGFDEANGCLYLPLLLR